VAKKSVSKFLLFTQSGSAQRFILKMRKQHFFKKLRDPRVLRGKITSNYEKMS
jgi:hypothetical protein